jgi:hypothetical protein
MNRIIITIILLIGLASVSYASTRGDVNVLEASDAIKLHVNDLSKNYMLYARFPNKRQLLPILKQDIDALGKSFQKIAVTTKDARTKGLLAFFAYQKARIEEILAQKPSPDSVSEILGMSESFIEGANAIAHHHRYDFSFEEKMLMLTHSISQHLEGIVKYYVAYNNDKTDREILKKLDHEIKAFIEEFSQIQQYKYSDPKIVKERERIQATWLTIEPYLSNAQQDSSLPMIISMAVEHMNVLLQDLRIYHSKNQ